MVEYLWQEIIADKIDLTLTFMVNDAMKKKILILF